MRGRRNKSFWRSADQNNRTYLMYFERLKELAINRFEWLNLPDSVDERFMELALFGKGAAVFFRDDVMDDFLCLRVMYGAPLDVYNIPTQRTAYANNGYYNQLNNTNSVIIWNNYGHTNCINDVTEYALRMYEIERTMDVNVIAQKTPIIILTDENQRLTMENLYMQYEGNSPFIFGNKKLSINDLTVLKTDAPFVADKLEILKRQIFNEALTYLGIPNSTSEKRERLVTDETSLALGNVDAQRNNFLNARKQACKQINKMFGLNIDVRFRTDLFMQPETVEENEVIE